MAYENGAIQVVTGPVLNRGNFQTIGPNQVSIPVYYYKVNHPGFTGGIIRWDDFVLRELKRFVLTLYIQSTIIIYALRMGSEEE